MRLAFSTFGEQANMKSRPTIIVPVRNREEFLSAYFSKGDLGGVFVPGALEVPVGELVDLEVKFLEEHVNFRIRGSVKWRRPVGNARVLPPGLGIEFLAAEEAARELLLAYATGREIAMVERDGRRFGCQIKVRHKGGGGESRLDETDDISEGGAFILTDDLVPVGTRFRLKLQPPGSLFGTTVNAVVAWTRTEGRRGFGVEFIFDSPRKRSQVLRVVAELKDRILHEVHAAKPIVAKPIDRS